MTAETPQVAQCAWLEPQVTAETSSAFALGEATWCGRSPGPVLRTLLPGLGEPALGADPWCGARQGA